MVIELTEQEKKTLLFYLEKSKIDAAGMAAIGVIDRKTVDNINSIISKVRYGNNH